MKNKLLKFFLKKRNRFKIMAIFVWLLLILNSACRGEFEHFVWEHKEAPKLIENAKAWYEANKPEAIGLRSSQSGEQFLMKAEWSHAFATENDFFEVVETNLMSQGRLLYVDESCKEKYDETNDPKYNQCYTRIVFRTDRKTNETVGFLMTVVPNLEWLEKSHFKPFVAVTYLFRSKDFGGMILFHEMDGRYSNGWRYEDGKIVATIGSMDVDPNSVTLRSLVCNTIATPYYRTTCVSMVVTSEDGYGNVNTICKSEFVGYTYITSCYYDGYYPDNNNGSNPPPGGYTGGTTGSGGNTPTPASVAPKATKIFRNTNLSLENWKILENMLNKIMNDCLGQSLYNGLTSSLKGGTLAIQFGSEYSFGYGTGGITLGGNESNRLFHEMWHAYESYQETYDTYKSNLLNLEIEARYAQYLYVSSLPEYAGSSWEKVWTTNQGRKEIANLKDYIDSYGKLHSGKTESGLDSYLRNNVLPVFQNSGTSYASMNYNTNRTGSNNFKNLQTLSKNC